MVDVPENTIKYAQLIYPDSSIRLIRFCNDEKALTRNFILPIEGSVYDLDRDTYVKLDNVNVKIFTVRPEMEVLHEFANQFI